MQIKMEISDKRITDLAHGHSGTYSPWLHKLTGKWNSKAGAKVVYDLESGEEGNGLGRMTIRKKDVARGLALFANNEAAESWKDFMSENDDEIAFDCFWQFVIFGKLVYG